MIPCAELGGRSPVGLLHRGCRSKERNAEDLVRAFQFFKLVLGYGHRMSVELSLTSKLLCLWKFHRLRFILAEKPLYIVLD